MGTALSVVSNNEPVLYVDPKKLNKAAAKAMLQRAAGPRGVFPGVQIKTNGQDGIFTLGFGAGAKTKDKIRMVINAPQAAAVWQYWPEGEGPSYPHIAAVFSGFVLPPRADCGPKETKYNELKEEDEDVWKEGIVLICRDPKTNDIYHLPCFGNPHRKAAEFLMDIADSEELEDGLLPLVELSFERIKLKNKKTFSALVFEVVEWVKATKADMPAELASAAVEDADEDDDEDEAPARKSRKSAPAKKAASKKRAVEDADEDEEDEKPARDYRKNPRTFEETEAEEAAEEDEDDEDEDDDRPVRRSRKAAAAPAKKASKKRVVEDEDEDEEPEEEDRPVRRRRRLN